MGYKLALDQPLFWDFDVCSFSDKRNYKWNLRNGTMYDCLFINLFIGTKQMTAATMIILSFLFTFSRRIFFPVFKLVLQNITILLKTRIPILYYKR